MKSIGRTLWFGKVSRINLVEFRPRLKRKSEKSVAKTKRAYVVLIPLENRKNYCSFVITSKSILRRGPAYIAETFEGQWPHDPESVGL